MDTDIGGLRIEYDATVLQPRPWTTAQARWMADELVGRAAGPLLELCSGVGHIGLLAAAYTGRDLVLVDSSDAACDLAERNAAANPVSGLVEVRRARVDQAIAPHERFTGILADPPWVPSALISAFPDDPPTAIDGGKDGLALARVCLTMIDRHLARDGVAILQLGSTGQADQVIDSIGPETNLAGAELRTFDRGVLLRLVRVG